MRRLWSAFRRASALERLTYPDRTTRVPRGFSVLEAIPHAHVCGGRGRCSTCRIRILGDLTGLSAPSATQPAVLERIHAAPVKLSGRRGGSEGLRERCSTRSQG